MKTQDKSGKPWAKLSEVKKGDLLRLDGGFTCAKGQIKISEDEVGLWFPCSHGRHYIVGQASDGEHIVGAYKV